MRKTKTGVSWIVILGMAALSGALAGPAPRRCNTIDAPGHAAPFEVGKPAAVAELPFQAADTVLMASAGLVMLMIPALASSTAEWSGARTFCRRSSRASSCWESSGAVGRSPATACRSARTCWRASAAGWQWFGLHGVGLEPTPLLAPCIPHQLFMIFQMMVAVFAAALISGAIAERMKFSSYLVFTLLWVDARLRPGGALGLGRRRLDQEAGALDFAGGLVVHLTSGLAALCCVLVLGKRKGLDHEDLHPHNLTLTALGTGLLWFGWLGLKAGQAAGPMRRRSRRSWRPTWPAAAAIAELELPRVFPEAEGDRARRLHRRDRRPGRRDARPPATSRRLGALAIGLLGVPVLLRRDPAQG